ncbi:MAG: hypothetical protein WD944_06465 [Steroidobacteraceae bacterium]
MPKRGAKPAKYKGELARPGAPVSPTTSKAEELFMPVPDDAKERALKEYVAKIVAYELGGLALLIKHYEIEELDPVMRFFELALALARDHVPYFQAERDRPGPKADAARIAVLALWTARLRHEGCGSDVEACQRLIDKGLYAKGMSAETLVRRLRDARKDPLVAAMLGVGRMTDPSTAAELRAE